MGVSAMLTCVEFFGDGTSKSLKWVFSDTRDLVDVLESIAVRPELPDDVEFEWVREASDAEDDDQVSEDAAFDAETVRDSLKWFVKELKSKQGLPEVVQQFKSGSWPEGLESYVAFLEDTAKEWIKLCNYAVKKEALVALQWVP